MTLVRLVNVLCHTDAPPHAGCYAITPRKGMLTIVSARPAVVKGDMQMVMMTSEYDDEADSSDIKFNGVAATASQPCAPPNKFISAAPATALKPHVQKVTTVDLSHAARVLATTEEERGELATRDSLVDSEPAFAACHGADRPPVLEDIAGSVNRMPDLNQERLGARIFDPRLLQAGMARIEEFDADTIAAAGFADETPL